MKLVKKCEHEWQEQIYGWGYCKKCKESWYVDALKQMLDMNEGIKLLNKLNDEKKDEKKDE
jgi:hypothetical protein